MTPLQGSSSKSRAAVLAGTSLLVLAVACLLVNVYIHVDYYRRLPGAPDSTSGRVNLVYAMHSPLFATDAEASRLHLVGLLVPVAAAAGLLGIGLLNAARRQRVAP